MRAPQAFERIARLAPSLSGAELRVVIGLTSIARPDDDFWARISCRELARLVGLSRSTVQAAVDGLSIRKLVTRRQGHAQVAAAYRAEWMRTGSLEGGPEIGPPGGEGGPKTGPQEALFSGQGGPKIGPLLADSSELVDLTSAVDIDVKNSIIDRLLRADAKSFDSAEIFEVRKLVGAYVRKFGPRGGTREDPDAAIAAQLLTVAPFPRIMRLLYDLLAERKPCYSHAWFVTVAVQRLLGVSAAELRVARERFRAVQGGRASSSGSDFQAEMVVAIAQVKRF